MGVPAWHAPSEPVLPVRTGHRAWANAINRAPHAVAARYVRKHSYRAANKLTAR